MSQVRQLRWYVTAFYRKHHAVLVGSTVLGVILFVLLSQIFRVLPTIKHVTYIGRVGRFSLAQIPRDIQEKISFGLTRVDTQGEALPALASSFVSEENGKAYRFTIHPSLVWQDGKPVSPSDVNYSFSDVATVRSQNDLIYRLTAKSQDETGLEPVLPVSFLTIVSQPLFRQVESRNIFLQKKQRIIGLGEYRLTSVIDQGSGIKELTLDSTKDRLIYRFYPTDHHALVAYKRGEVDKIEELLDTEDVGSWRGTQIVPVVHPDQFVGIFFNLTYKDGENTVFSNKQIRQALNYALTKPEQNRFLSPINRNSWAYIANPQDIDHFERDMSQAASLLTKSETPTKLKIELQTIPTYALQAEKIKREWEELGVYAYDLCVKSKDAVQSQCDNKRISVDVRISNFPDPQNYAVMLVGQQVPFDPDQYSLWHSTQATNITHYKNPKVDKLLEDGRRTQNKEERRLIYQEFQSILVKESPVIFLTPITTFNVSRSLKLL